jgi:protein kinase C substrate 80K-H
VKCEDRCAAVGVKARKIAETKAKSLNAALRKRAELIHKAEEERKTLETNIATWNAELASDAQRILEAERAFAEAQAQDKLRLRKEATKEGQLEKLRDLTKVRITELRVNLGMIKQQKYDAEFRVRELEGILATFKEEYNPNFNDEGVKRASKAWEEYESRGRLSPDWETENKAQELVREDTEYGINWDDYYNVGSESVGGCKFSSFHSEILLTLDQCTISHHIFRHRFAFGSTLNSNMPKLSSLATASSQNPPVLALLKAKPSLTLVSTSIP